MSTIGAKVQFKPPADASMAATRSEFSIAFVSHEEASARGIGNIVLYPWITSYPNMRGILRRVSSTAIF
jgi:hypothetical protein